MKPMVDRLRRRLRDDDSGTAVVELLIAIVPMIMMVLFVVLVWRLAGSEGEVQDAAQAGARAASLARTPGEAVAAGQSAALEYLPANSSTCSNASVAVDAGGFFDGTVTVTVTCNTDNSDLGLIGRAGSDAVTATWTEAVDLARTARGAP